MSIERIIPESTDPSDRSLQEHLERYRTALRFVEPGDTVVDAGCGVGYGSAMLAEGAKRVIGLDVSAEALEHARTRFPRPNLEFRRLDLDEEEIPECDVLVALECIEHLERPEEFLSRALARTARLAVISTPVTPTTHRNEFHLHDWEAAEVESMVQPWNPLYKRLQAGSDKEVYGLWAFARRAEPDAALLLRNLDDQYQEMMRYHVLIKELSAWNEALDEGREWLEKKTSALEEEVWSRERQIGELKDWIEQLEQGKQWLTSHARGLEEELEARGLQITELRQSADDLQRSKERLEARLFIEHPDERTA
jgi:SAM-dependent methyltransferase